ncbi:hypothetical protein ACVIU7_006180 [Bradyrhizobium liaoningense]
MAEATDYTNSIARQENEDALAEIKTPRVTSNSSGCGQSNSSTREAGQGTVSLSLFPGQELQRLL